MRIMFSNLSRPKAAAKWLSRLSPKVKLSAAQGAIARATGYRDWYELAGADLGVPTALDLEEARHVVLTVSEALGLSPGDVQFAVSKSRLLSPAPWGLDEQLTLTTRIWRECIFGMPARGKPGTIVKVRAHGETRLAYLSRTGRPTHVVYDTGPGICADFEAVTPRVRLADFVPARLWLPYGYWTLRDGSEVIFARDYLPMWRIADGDVERLDPWLWIEGIADTTVYSSQLSTVVWARGAAREKALEHLARHRIFELPRLVDVMPHLIGANDVTVQPSVERWRLHLGGGKAPPSYARLNPFVA